MGTFKFPKGRFNEQDWTKFIKAIENMNNFDYDSGWIKLPSNKTVTHNLGIVPKMVQVQSSTASNGAGYKHENATNVDTKTVGFTGVSNPYVRVLINK